MTKAEKKHQIQRGRQELEKMRQNGGRLPWYSSVPWFGPSILAAYDDAH